MPIYWMSRRPSGLWTIGGDGFVPGLNFFYFWKLHFRGDLSCNSPRPVFPSPGCFEQQVLGERGEYQLRFCVREGLKRRCFVFPFINFVLLHKVRSFVLYNYNLRLYNDILFYETFSTPLLIKVLVAHASDFFLWNFQTVGLYYYYALEGLECQG